MIFWTQFRSQVLRPILKSNEIVFQSTRTLYEQTRSGSMEFERKKLKQLREKSEIERLKLGVKAIKNEIAWTWDNFKNRTIYAFSSDNKRMTFEDQEIVKFWDFNQANNGKVSSFLMEHKTDKLNDMNNWSATCDADFDIGLYLIY